MPRPSLYSKELALQICTKLAEGMPLVKICKGQGMPTVTTVYAWLADDLEFRRMYERAREDQADTMFSQIHEIANETPVMLTDDKGRKRIDPAWSHVQRNRIDAYKWAAAKLKPKKYGEYQQVEHKVEEGPFSQQSALEIARRTMFLLNAGLHEQEEMRQRVRPALPLLINANED